MKILFVVNPISGGVDKEPFLKQATTYCEKYGLVYEIFKTTGQNDQKNLRAVLADFKPDKVASVGGDGTTLFTALALLDSGYAMGIIPLGSANGMATELFVDPDPFMAFKDLVASQVVAGLDLVCINGEHYTLHMGDVGINAHIVASYEKDPQRGMATYAKYFLAELTRLSPFSVSVMANGKTVDEEVLMIGICNARKYGTGVPLNLDGNPMDGKFELVLVKTVNTTSLIKAGMSKFNESYFDAQSSLVIPAEKALITFDQPRVLQLDGEVIGKYRELQVEMLKGAVRLITHNNNSYVK